MRRRDLMLASLAACAAAPAAEAAPRPVVLELFTSQGCSSCPPADALLGKLAQRPEVIALAWHVDYWNHLGWRDQFASRRATERQQAYARQLEAEVFTPALVIDGATVVVGSDRAAVERAIGATKPLAVAVALTDTGVDVGAGPARLRALRVLYDPNTRPTLRQARTKGRACANIASCGRWTCWASGTARHGTSPYRRPARAKVRSSWCRPPIFALSAQPIAQQ